MVGVGPEELPAAVVNVAVNGPVMTVPLELVTPVTVKVYVMFAAKAAVGVIVATYVVALYVTAPATALFFPLVSVMLVVFTVVALAGPENVTKMAAVVATWVAPDAGDEEATENVPDGVVVAGVVLLPDEQPVISATKKMREVKATLEKFDLSCMAIAPFSKEFCVRDGSVQT
jgi:uncharacterized membrane protein YccC